MDEQESLSSILGSEPVADVKPAAEPAAAASSAAKEPEQAEKQPTRDESGKFAKADKAEAKPDEKPESKPSENPEGAAVVAERRKWQQRIRDLENQIRTQPKPAEKPPSVFDDEEKAISTRIEAGTAPLQERLFKQSMKIARLTHGDSFAQAEEAFAQAMESDPRLLEAWRAADDPGEYVYVVGLQIKELADVGGDFVKYREKITGDFKGQLAEKDTRIAALQAELEALKNAQKDLESIPTSLNGATSGPPPKATEADAESLNKIVRFGNS